MSAHRRHLPPSAEDALAWSPAGFPAEMTRAGVARPVAEELERRIAVIEGEEAADESRRPLSGIELGCYVLTTVLVCALGLMLVAL